MQNNKEMELSLEERLIELEGKLVESEDKFLRLYADFENYKKRVSKEKIDLVTNTKNNMLSTILDIDNDLSIAVNNLDNSAKEGVSLIIKKMEALLVSNNVESIQTETYDSEIHEVIGVNSKDNNEILAVVSKGYSIDGKIVRHPKIILGK